MRLKAGDLEAHLAKTLAPLYAVHGDEPLLAMEAADAVRAAARRRGYAEREVFEAGRGFDWGELAHAGASRSLFGDRKIVELRLPTGKPAAAASQAIVAWCRDPNPDALLLLTMPRPEGMWWKSEWFAALDAAGAAVEVETVSREALPRWLGQRLARQKQSASPEVLEFIAQRVEGNLLAAHQELQKLALLAPQGALDLATVEGAVASVARYDPYRAAEALLAGDLERYLRIIEGLRGEGEEPTFVLWVIAGALFVTQGLAAGGQIDALSSRHRFFARALRGAMEAAARRLPAALLDDALAQAAAIDRAIKGVAEGRDAWQGFMTLGLKLAGGSKA